MEKFEKQVIITGIVILIVSVIFIITVSKTLDEITSIGIKNIAEDIWEGNNQ